MNNDNNNNNNINIKTCDGRTSWRSNVIAINPRNNYYSLYQRTVVQEKCNCRNSTAPLFWTNTVLLIIIN